MVLFERFERFSRGVAPSLDLFPDHGVSLDNPGPHLAMRFTVANPMPSSSAIWSDPDAFDILNILPSFSSPLSSSSRAAAAVVVTLCVGVGVQYLLPNGDTGIIRTLDVPLYLTKAAGQKLFCLDREGKTRTVEIDNTEVCPSS